MHFTLKIKYYFYIYIYLNKRLKKKRVWSGLALLTQIDQLHVGFGYNKIKSNRPDDFGSNDDHFSFLTYYTHP